MRALLGFTILALFVGSTAVSAKEIDCEMKFELASWSIFYKRGDGKGVITCDNGQSFNVTIRAHGGGISFGKMKIKDGKGQFSPVDNVDELFGAYAQADAHAGAGGSAQAQVMTKGTVSLALSGTGKGVNIGFAFGGFKIEKAGAKKD